jgi:hypothetical protein
MGAEQDHCHIGKTKQALLSPKSSKVLGSWDDMQRSRGLRQTWLSRSLKHATTTAHLRDQYRASSNRHFPALSTARWRVEQLRGCIERAASILRTHAQPST